MTEDFSRILSEEVIKNPAIVEAMVIAKENSHPGGYWLIGGHVYRTIIEHLHGVPRKESFDVDIIVESMVDADQYHVPNGWELTVTGLGSPRFIKNNKQIDLIILDTAVHPDDVSRVSMMTVEEKILSYMRRTPLTVQSIVYDIVNQKVFGDVGLAAIRERTVAINCREKCINFCKRHNLEINDFISTKARELGFRTIL